MDGEHVCGVAGEGFDGEAGEDFGRGLDGGLREIRRLGVTEARVIWGEAAAAVRIEQGELAGGEKRIVVGREIADAVAVVLQAAVREFAGGEEVARVGEGGCDAAVGVESGVPAAVIEVEMRVQNVGDVFGADAGSGERGGEELVVLVELALFGESLLPRPVSMTATAKAYARRGSE